MNGSTHIALSKEVAKALDWKGDINLLARSAYLPDTVQTIAVEKYGFHIIGKGLSSLVHFTRPTKNGKYEGYCWALDKSVLGLDISKVKVIAYPEGWGFPINEEWQQKEPFGKLVRDLQTPGHIGSIEADQITYTAASIMAEWAYECYVWCSKNLTGEECQKALDILAGILYHLSAQDPSIPHHSQCVMLDGHSAFEGDLDELFKIMFASGELAALIESAVKADNVPSNLTVRALAEKTATKAVVSRNKLHFYHCFWQRGWKKLVKQSLLRGIIASVQLGKILQRTS